MEKIKRVLILFSCIITKTYLFACSFQHFTPHPRPPICTTVTVPNLHVACVLVCKGTKSQSHDARKLTDNSLETHISVSFPPQNR